MSKKRWNHLIAFFIALSLLFSACNSPAEITSTPEGPAPTREEPASQATTAPLSPTAEPPASLPDAYESIDPTGQVITFWHPYTGDLEAALSQLISEFNATNQWGITVDAGYQGSQDDLFDKMLTFMNTAEAPHLLVASPAQAASYYLAGAMIDMDGLLYSEKWGLAPAEIADFFPGLLRQDSRPDFDGLRLGFPIDSAAEVLYYNADWLAELGYSAPPATPAEFQEMACKAVSQPFSGATAGGSMGYPLNIAASRFASFTYAFGGDFYDAAATRYRYDNPAAVEALTFLQGLFQAGCASLVTERDGDRLEFSQGTALFTIASSAELSSYQRGVEAGSSHNWSVAPLPHTTAEPLQLISGASLAIPKTSPAAQLAAWLFLEFLASPENQARWALAANTFPARASAAAGMGDHFAAHPAYVTAFELLPYGLSQPPAFDDPLVQDMIAETFYAASLGARVTDLLATLNADIAAYLEEQRAAPPQTPDPWAGIDPSGQTVTFWHQQPPARQAALEELIWKFNSTNKWGITVVAEYQGDRAEIDQKLQSVIGAPDAPDLVELYPGQAADYQLAQALADMTSLVESIKWGLSPQEQVDFFPGIYLQDINPTFGDARLGFPFYRSAQVLYYNQDWLAGLKAAGLIDFDGPPATPEQFQSAACAARQQPFSQSAPEGSLGYEINLDASTFASFTFAFGGVLFDASSGQYTFDTPAAIAALTFLQDLVEEDCAAAVREPYGDQADFAQGSLLFAVGSSAGLPYYDDAVAEGAAFAWSVAAIPHTTANPVMVVHGPSLSLTRGTPESELAAWLFVRHLASLESQASWARASLYFPVRPGAAAGLADHFAANPAYRAAFDLLPYSQPEPSTPGYDAVRDMLAEALAAILAGAEVDETLIQLDLDANAHLAGQLGR